MPPSQDQPQYSQPGQQPQGGAGGPAPQDQSSQSPLKIDDNLLTELGLATLPAEEKQSLRQHIYETLEMRVGMRLADQMTNEQLDEFEAYFNAKDDAGAFRWLETNFPNYKDIVADEFNKLKAEVGQQAPQILAAAQQAPAASQSVPDQYSQAGYAQQPQPDQQQYQGPPAQQPYPPQPQQPPAAPQQDQWPQPPQYPPQQ